MKNEAKYLSKKTVTKQELDSSHEVTKSEVGSRTL